MNYKLFAQVVSSRVIATLGSFHFVMQGNETHGWFETSPTPLLTGLSASQHAEEASWKVTAHAQKPDFVFRRNGGVYLNRRGGRQFSRLLAAEVCASAVVMLDAPCSEVVWRVLATHSIRQFPLHFPSRVLPCAITFQLESTLLYFEGLACCFTLWPPLSQP